MISGRLGGKWRSEGRRPVQSEEHKLNAVQNWSQCRSHSSGWSTRCKSKVAGLFIHQLQRCLLWPFWIVCASSPRKLQEFVGSSFSYRSECYGDTSRGWGGCFRISRSSLRLISFSWDECSLLPKKSKTSCQHPRIWVRKGFGVSLFHFSFHSATSFSV